MTTIIVLGFLFAIAATLCLVVAGLVLYVACRYLGYLVAALALLAVPVIATYLGFCVARSVLNMSGGIVLVTLLFLFWPRKERGDTCP